MADSSRTHRKRVAVIGAGASGIVTARYLLKHGADVVVFEKHSGVGGQWDCHSPYSGVWHSMRTNTCSVTTQFSDLRHASDVCLFPRNQKILAYLKRYATTFGVLEHVRFNTRVMLLEPLASGWQVISLVEENHVQHEEFDAVVIASGRFTKPYIPSVHGLESFSGDAGVVHSYRYMHPERFKGQRVVVGGGSISAYEISTSLVMAGAREVVTAGRRVKYLVGRLFRGVPTEYLKHSRYEGMLAEVHGKKYTQQRLQHFIEHSMGRPEQFSSLQPEVPFPHAGISTSETFLPLVAEGHITPKPWISRVAGKNVYYSDGTVTRDVDCLLMCTGYDLEIPFLSQDVIDHIQLTRKHIPLAWQTFHPAYPTLAFLGFWFHSGSVFVSTEQQARFVAYVFSGVQKPPAQGAMERELQRYMRQKASYGKVSLTTYSQTLSKVGGFAVDLYAYPELARYLLFGPMTSSSFRLNGIDALSDAPQRIMEDAARFGILEDGVLTAQERRQLRELAALKNDAPFTRYVKQILRAAR
ncbi:MAG: FAD-dependent oxidoreductase [Desulfovibrionales bacterium]|nr:FAD-dependent oxidoreductase [Desulfovibrionales bacterium]